MDSMIIRKVDLPIEVDGITVLDENGDYNIYLNSRLSYDSQADAFRHEVEHVRQGHFYRYEDIKVLEEQAEYNVG
ncbi:hypothetical protein [Aminipila luticellarii]|uniref:IrrE N-terminal-like domain-containing protein n=1 Tax=Aminipila luticellarii TaxID=2507160 RepID=A0A410PX14_9FIRM|nr:hypothetical protein [Aminipila luticellarii]QAT43477.1 hypothetical protein EQM06_09760 [Aminipila luticellarii]